MNAVRREKFTHAEWFSRYSRALADMSDEGLGACLRELEAVARGREGYNGVGGLADDRDAMSQVESLGPVIWSSPKNRPAR